eukprot:12982700-Alexandrium_andersonii.AAC.1
MADCGFRRTGALTGLGRIADCTLGTLQCKDARLLTEWAGASLHPDRLDWLLRSETDATVGERGPRQARSPRGAAG